MFPTFCLDFVYLGACIIFTCFLYPIRKSVCIQYITAIATLKELRYQPVRTILVSFVPDEEIGGVDGMGVLLSSAWFKAQNIGCALDEGLASEDDDFSIFYGERLPCWIHVEAKGNTGHASRFIDGTAVEQLLGVANKAMDFRREQKTLLHGSTHHKHAGCSHSVAAAKKKTLGDVTSLNITVLHASVVAGDSEAINVIPDTAEMKMDIRIAPHVPPEDIATMLDGWCREITSQTSGIPNPASTMGGGGLTWKQINNTPKQHYVTSYDPAVNPWYNTIMTCIQSQCGIKLNPSVFPAATDSRFLRALGIKAFGFSPMRRSQIMLHENDEFLSIDVFIEGCEIYARLLRALTLTDVFEPYVDPSMIEFKSGGCTWNGNESDAEESVEGCPMGNFTATEDEDIEENNDNADISAKTESTSVEQHQGKPVTAAKCPYGYA